MRAMIVDDETYAREGLRKQLESLVEVEVVAEASSGRQALEMAGGVAPDVLFLDIQMPGMDGFEVVDDWPGRLPLVVFVTAYDEFAVKAFETRAMDYLLKPVETERLSQAVERLYDSMGSRQGREQTMEQLLLEMRLSGDKAEKPLRRVSIRSHAGEEFLDMQDVDWIEAQNYYAAFHAGVRTLLAKISLKRLERELDPERFVRIHRSTIVAIDFIARVSTDDPGEWYAVLKDGTHRRVSRSGRRLLQKKVTSIP